jgi:hypothetical protein
MFAGWKTFYRWPQSFFVISEFPVIRDSAS